MVRAKTGRPLKTAVAGKKMSLGLKVTPSIKEKLDSQAALHGRTQSQEAELRLEQSFREEDLLPRELTWAYGTRLAGILLAVAETVKIVGPLVRTKSIWKMVDGKIVGIKSDIGDWSEDERTSAKAARLLIDCLLTPDFIEDYENTSVEERLKVYGEKAVGAVTLTLMGLRGKGPYEKDERWKRISAMVGELPPPPKPPEKDKP